jgi:hypothetical protein
MRLENLFKNFSTSSTAEQLEFLVSYRLRRAEDMEKPSTFRKKKAPSTASAKPTLTEEEKLLMKLLGLKPKDLIALRGAANQDSDEEDDHAEELFKDPAFADVEEE